MSSYRNSLYGTTILVGVVLLTAILAAVLVFAPIATCPNCNGEGRASIEVDDWWVALHPELKRDKIALRFSVECSRCNYKRKIPPLKAWIGPKYKASAR
jgi:hypothetical protein